MTAEPRNRVLVIGGRGVFGSRLVDAILATTELQIIIASRNPTRAAPTHPRIETTVLDTATLTPEALRATGAFALIDAAGPFQGQDYRVAKAAIAAGLHYIDLADGRAFVTGIPALDAAARAANVAVLSGASSTPALSNAALDAITAGWRQIDTVSIAISPGNRAPRGLSVVQSILSYVGQPLRIFLDGAWTHRPGWGLTRRTTIPGLGPRFLSLCDTPDLDIVPSRLAIRRTVRFDAGLELPVLHLGLVAASLLVRARLIRTLAPWAAPIRTAATLVERLGTDRGGMLVQARGRDPAGHCIEASWTLLAEAGDGPNVPTLPALAALRALSTGQLTWRGAAPCVGLLPLADIEREFTPWRITTAIQTHQSPANSLFANVLGPSFDNLPTPIQAVHSPGWSLTLEGRASVDGATTPLARIAARLFGFPPAAPDIPVRVTIDRTPAGERWTRVFGPSRFRSHLSPGSRPGHLRERFGPFRFDLLLTASNDKLHLVPHHWQLGPIPLPRILAPTSDATESVDAQSRFHFDVAISLPFRCGRIVRYRGWLRPAIAPPGTNSTPFEDWRTRDDSNVRPLPSEGNALSS